MRWQPWIAAGAALLVLAVTSEAPASRPVRTGETPMLAREELLRLFGRGYLNLLADYYWLQTIQATGLAYDRWTYRDIYFYADHTTDLDPQFRYVYRFAAPAMTVNLGRDTWVNTEESTRLLEKGLQQFPTDVYLRMLYALNLSYYHGRYAEAAKVLEDTRRLPDAPAYVGRLATRLYAQGGRVELALNLARELYASARDEDTRRQIEGRILELELEQQLQRIDAAVTEFTAKQGRAPSSVEELVTAGALTPLPVDPSGGQFVLRDGRAYSTSIDRRLEIHRLTGAEENK